MKFSLERSGSAHRVRAYDQRGFRIGEAWYPGGIVLSAERLVSDWGPARIDNLLDSDLHTILEMEPEVVVIGTGATLRFPDRSRLAVFRSKGIGYEVMDSGAACRTFNVLCSEGRRVVAALLPIRQ